MADVLVHLMTRMEAIQTELEELKKILTQVGGPQPNRILANRFLIPSAHKLYDFRQEPGFAEAARAAIGHGRTLLDYNRLYTLWQGVKNTFFLNRSVAEVGSFRGGSAWFLGASHTVFQRRPPIYVFDTFEGHPDHVDTKVDGPHSKGMFSNTSYEQVKQYLSQFPNIVVTQGEFEKTHPLIENQTFALVHIDVDIQASTQFCLNFFWPRLCANGIVVVDDYGFVTCQGLKTVVDQFVAQHADCQSWYIHTGQFVISRLG